jgi:Ca-activated chloride channel family protein
MIPQFANPWLLLLALVLLPLAAWWLWQRRRTFRLPAAGQLAALASTRARVARWGGILGRVLALLLLVIAAAGPRWPDLRTRIDTEGIAILMLVDVSGSMAEQDFDWNGQAISRLDAVKRVFRLFVAGAQDTPTGDGADASALKGRPTDLVGLVTFATRPTTACPLTLSHSVLLRMLDDEMPRSIPGESETNISDGIALALHRLHSAGDRRKVLVLLTDGEHNVPQPRSGWTPRQAAQVAASLEVPIYAIDAGGLTVRPEAAAREGAGEPAASPAANRAEAIHTLEELARISKGRYFQARDTAALLDACRTIDRLERSNIHSFQYRRYHEGYPWFALASFACLALILALEMTVWRRLP